MTRLIGLGGRLRSGKDAVADVLVDRYGFTKLGMSDALIEAALVLDPYIPVNTHAATFPRGEHGLFVRLSHLVEQVGYVDAKKNPEVRRFLQKLGTEFGRQMIGEFVWTDIMYRKIDRLRGEGHSVVVTGIRFPNEIDLITSLNGDAVYVERPGLPKDVQGHVSENSIGPSDFDAILCNDGTLDDLPTKIEALLAPE
jgi:hypothetical protein